MSSQVLQRGQCMPVERPDGAVIGYLQEGQVKPIGIIVLTVHSRSRVSQCNFDFASQFSADCYL